MKQIQYPNHSAGWSESVSHSAVKRIGPYTHHALHSIPQSGTELSGGATCLPATCLPYAMSIMILESQAQTSAWNLETPWPNIQRHGRWEGWAALCARNCCGHQISKPASKVPTGMEQVSPLFLFIRLPGCNCSSTAASCKAGKSTCGRN